MALLGLGVSQIARLAAALVEGDDSIIEKIIEKKFEDLGEEFIQQFLGGPLETVGRVERAIDTGGASEFDRFRNEWLSKVRPPTSFPGLPGKILSKLQDAYNKSDRDIKRRWSTVWGRTNWASSRQDWLDNRWRHDWRSQPRDVHGRWIPGRLDHIAPALMYSGKHVGRTVRTFRKKRRARRAAARKLARRMMQVNDGN